MRVTNKKYILSKAIPPKLMLLLLRCIRYSYKVCILAGLTIVQEWGILRWGLREEYPVYGYPRFYRNSNRKVAAVKCGKDKKGSHVDYVTGGECTLDRTTGLPTSTCYFKPDIDVGVSGSVG